MSKICSTFTTPVEMCTNEAKYLVSLTGREGVTTESRPICTQHIERYILAKLGKYLAAHIALVSNND